MQLNELSTEELAVIAKLFGSLFFYSPSQFDKVKLDIYLAQGVETPVTVVNQVLDAFQLSNREELTVIYRQTFSGMVPPWASFYLEPGMKHMGTSTVAYHDFIRHCGLELVTETQRPQDHVGLMLIVLGLLLEDNQIQHAREMLGEYLLPWFGYFARQMHSQMNETPYNTLLSATESLLSLLTEIYAVTVVEKQNYFNLIVG